MRARGGALLFAYLCCIMAGFIIGVRWEPLPPSTDLSLEPINARPPRGACRVISGPLNWTDEPEMEWYSVICPLGVRP